LKKVAFITLGCKVNQVETEQIKEKFLAKGYQIVSFNEKADVYIINTCTVTHISDRKSRAMVRRAVRNNPNAVVAAIGCLAQVDPNQLAAIEGVNLVVGNKDKDMIADKVEDYVSPEINISAGAISSDDKLQPCFYTQKHQRTRGFIKIQDGCENFCSYCIVPYTRGPIRSKLPGDILQEINQLISLGYREIILSGIHTGCYGKDLTGWKLVNLIAEILDKVTGDYRLRLSSIEPLEVNEELINLIANNKKICRHLHIPLQSGSNKVLKDMSRHYTREYYCNLLTSINKRIPGIALTADVMVGFPTEGEEEFNDTYNLLKVLPIMDLHVFKYSSRPGTRASKLPVTVSDQQKQSRSEMLIKLAQAKHQVFLQEMVGKKSRVLMEKRYGNNEYLGITDNYVNTYTQYSGPDLTGELVECYISDLKNDLVIGSIIND